MNIKKRLPILESLEIQTREDWKKDLIAGITVAVMLVPQGMAYAMLAGVPPIYGLYGGLIPLLLYAIFGTSRQMSIGPVAISALLVLAGLSQIAEPFSPEYISLVILAGLMIGVVQILLGLMRLGFLVNFISHPVIIGFTSAAAIIIMISQLKDLLGIEIPRFTNSYDTAKYAFNHITEANPVSVAMCLGSVFVILLLRKISRSIPGPLVVVFLGTLLVYFLGEKKLGIDIVGGVPSGLPAFQIPEMTFEKIKTLLPIVFTVTIIGIVESIGIAKVIQNKKRTYTIRPNQELLALGLSKIGGAFFQALPTSGSFSRSAVNNESGAQSGFASVFTALIIGLTLLFFTPLFYFLPKSILAAIILLSVFGLFEIEEAMHLWKIHRSDFFMMLTTFFVTLAIGIEEGVLAGVILSIMMVLYKSAKPHMVVLGKLPDTRNYRNVDRFDAIEEQEGVLIIRFDEQLFFANASYFKDMIKYFEKEDDEPIELFLLDASNIHNIDSTGIHAIEDIQKYFQQKDITFYVSGLKGPVRDRIAKAGLIEKLGEKSIFLDNHLAITHFKSQKKGQSVGWNPDALQSNFESEI